MKKKCKDAEEKSDDNGSVLVSLLNAQVGRKLQVKSYYNVLLFYED